MPVFLPPPVHRVDLHVDLGGVTVDLATRALAIAVVPPPRFGREGEVLAGVAAARAAGAALAEVPLEPRLIGPAAQRGGLPIAVRARTGEQAELAHHAGATLILVPPDLVASATSEGWPIAPIVEDVRDVAGARNLAERHGLPLAVDTARLTEAEALAAESVAIAAGCRLVRTSDVRRTRRVAEVVAALLEARHER